MNPSLKDLHLKLLKIFNETKEELEEKLGEWKPELENNEDVYDPEEVSEPPAKLPPKC